MLRRSRLKAISLMLMAPCNFVEACDGTTTIVTAPYYPTPDANGNHY